MGSVLKREEYFGCFLVAVLRYEWRFQVERFHNDSFVDSLKVARWEDLRLLSVKI